MKAHPGPMVSGSHFLPNAPLLWVKWMPAGAVMSRKFSCAPQGRTNHRDTEAQRRTTKRISLWLRASVVYLFFTDIYREAPAAVAVGRASLRETAEAAVPT